MRADEPACPHDNCGNDSMDSVEDDPDFDWFCHWCGSLFEDEELDR